MQLGAVGGVVEHHDHPALRGAQERLEVGQAHQPAAVAGDEHGGAVGAGHRDPGGGAEAEADGLEGGADQDHGLRVRHGQVHRGPADEVAAVHHHGALGGEDVLEGGDDGAGVEPAVRAELGRVLDRGGAAEGVGGDLRGGRPPGVLRGGGGDPAGESLEERSQVRAHVVGDRGRAVLGLVVDADHPGALGEERAVAQLEGVQRCPGDQHDVGLPGELQTVGAGEAPGDAQVPRGAEDPGGHGGGHEQRPEPVPDLGERGGGPGQEHSAPGEDQGPGRRAQQPGDAVEVLGGGREGGLDRQRLQDGLLGEGGGGVVVGEGQHHRLHGLGGEVEGPVGDRGRVVRGRDQGGDPGGGGRGGLVDVEGPPPGGRGVADDQDQGDPGQPRLGQGGVGVGEPGTVGGRGGPGPPGGPVVGVGHGNGGGLVPGGGEAEAAGGQRADQVRVAVAHQAEQVVGALGEHVGHGRRDRGEQEVGGHGGVLSAGLRWEPGVGAGCARGARTSGAARRHPWVPAGGSVLGRGGAQSRCFSAAWAAARISAASGCSAT